MRRAVSSVARVFYRALALGRPNGPHVTRFTMYDRLSRFTTSEGVNQEVLSISGSDDLCEVFGFTGEKTKTSYPDVTLLNLPYKDNSFDAVIADQVLEHVEGDPALAMAESFRVVRPGGLVVHTTCLIMPMHMQPHDYWRFTPHGLKYLAQPHGNVIEADGWGHPSIVLLDLLGLRHEPIPKAWWHPAHMIATASRQSWPVVTWIVARKPVT